MCVRTCGYEVLLAVSPLNRLSIASITQCVVVTLILVIDVTSDTETEVATPTTKISQLNDRMDVDENDSKHSANIDISQSSKEECAQVNPEKTEVSRSSKDQIVSSSSNNARNDDIEVAVANDSSSSSPPINLDTEDSSELSLSKSGVSLWFENCPIDNSSIRCQCGFLSPNKPMKRISSAVRQFFVFRPLFMRVLEWIPADVV